MPDTIDDAQEHQIIFNEWSIQRILTGEKTQTRRVVKPQPPPDYPDALSLPPRHCGRGTTGYLKNGEGWYWRMQTAVDEAKWMPVGGSTGCPYGQPGDVLWVREAFRLPKEAEGLSPTEYLRGDQWDYISTPYRYVAGGGGGGPSGSDLDWGRKRPSIHMPKELCRLRLRVEDVRVERVQEITTTDAVAEGISPDPFARYAEKGNGVNAFRRKWNDIHGDGAWERNDWVWVVEFSQIDNA